jgi:hypothetical protein
MLKFWSKVNFIDFVERMVMKVKSMVTVILMGCITVCGLGHEPMLMWSTTGLVWQAERRHRVAQPLYVAYSEVEHWLVRSNLMYEPVHYGIFFCFSAFVTYFLFTFSVSFFRELYSLPVPITRRSPFYMTSHTYFLRPPLCYPVIDEWRPNMLTDIVLLPGWCAFKTHIDKVWYTPILTSVCTEIL